MKLKFSKKELNDLLYADVMLSIAFSILFVGVSTNIILIFPIMFLAMTFSFIVHEMSHKFVAQKYKYIAEFRANKSMLWMTIIMSIFGFIIAAPGAVHIIGHYDYRKQGKIAFAGPFSNIIIAIIFLGLTFISTSIIIHYIYFINAILAVFNMLPLPNFDGKKIWAWNKTVYIIAGIVALFLWSLPMMFA